MHSHPVCPALATRLVRVTLVFLVLLAIGLGVTLAIGDGELVTRVHFARWVQRHLDLLRIVTDFGLYPFYILFLALLAYGLARGTVWMQRLAQAYILAQLLGSVLVVRVMKMALGRARPDATPLPGFESDWAGFSWDSAHHSFPSGHTADIVTSAIFMALLIRRPWLASVFIVWALILAMTRLALAKHYPSDALAGALVALGACYGVVRWWLLPRLERQPPNPVPRGRR